MTGQAADRVVYQGAIYSITGQKGKGLFSPHELDLLTIPLHTACWRGYYCDYTVREDKLLLTYLVMRTKDGGYPMIGRVKPRGPENEPLDEHAPPPELLRGMSISQKRGSDEKVIAYEGAIYPDLSVPVSFSGGLLIAKDFIQSRYVHMGFQKPTSFKTVIELLFEAGSLTSAIDHSAKIAQARKEQIMSRPPAGFDDPKAQDQYLDDWIAYTFSLDYNI